MGEPWSATAPERVDPDLVAGERHSLEFPDDPEYARHNGHADLLREMIDGLTGD